MNEFNRQQLAEDDSGLLESCDRCNCLIHGWDHISLAFVTFDGRVICNDCRRVELIESIENDK